MGAAVPQALLRQLGLHTAVACVCGQQMQLWPCQSTLTTGDGSFPRDGSFPSFSPPTSSSHNRSLSSFSPSVAHAFSVPHKRHATGPTNQPLQSCPRTGPHLPCHMPQRSRGWGQQLSGGQHSWAVCNDSVITLYTSKCSARLPYSEQRGVSKGKQMSNVTKLGTTQIHPTLRQSSG